MPLSVRIISSPDGESITEWNKPFPEDGGDIGRVLGVTMQLSDSTRAKLKSLQNLRLLSEEEIQTKTEKFQHELNEFINIQKQNKYGKN